MVDYDLDDDTQEIEAPVFDPHQPTYAVNTEGKVVANVDLETFGNIYANNNETKQIKKGEVITSGDVLFGSYNTQTGEFEKMKVVFMQINKYGHPVTFIIRNTLQKKKD